MAKYEKPPAPDQNSVFQILAYYDVRGVSDKKLAVIFACSQADLEDARQQQEYKDAISAERAQFEAVRAELDDNWDRLERTALGSLIDSLEATSDPRLLLGAAVQANKAARRNAASIPDGSKAIIDVTPKTGNVTVVRLRSAFLKIMQDENGARQMLKREAEIVSGNTSDLHEDMTPREVQALLKRAIDVDPTDVHSVVRRGNTEDDGAFDFNFDQNSEFIKRLAE